MLPEVPKNVGYIFGPKCNNKYARNNNEVKRLLAKLINHVMCSTLMLKAACEGVA